MQKEKIYHIHCLITFNIYSHIKHNCGKVKFCSYVVSFDSFCALMLLGPLYAASPFGLHLWLVNVFFLLKKFGLGNVSLSGMCFFAKNINIISSFQK